ncbi:MAG TPA: ABC transporter substrate-binding protein, partial [Dehalococcoidia bacterium]|nr:ABC transporter substrate-binding protein [Dehalococcoidia bacterium]
APTTASVSPTAGTSAPAALATTTSAPPGKGKVLLMTRSLEPTSPFVGWMASDNASGFVMVNIYDCLVRATKDGQGVDPALATKWETSPDGKTWTFTLRDVKFSDNKPVTAADVKASLDKARLSDKSQWKNLFRAVTDVQAVDDQTVKILLSQPHPPLLAELSQWSAQVMPADMANAVEQQGYDTYKTRGTGAYMLDGWKKGDPLILKKNPNYWKQPHNGPDEVHIDYVADDNSRVLKLQGGETDVIDFVPYSQIATLNQGSTKAQGFPIETILTFNMNVTIKPLDDKKVRQALNYALDKEAIIKAVFFGYAKFMNSPLPPGTYYWDQTLKGYPYDLDKAKQLMAASSVPQGFTYKQTVPAGDTVKLQVATIAKDQWAKIGVTVDLQQLEPATYSSQFKKGTSMAWFGTWTNDMSDPTEIANANLRGGPPRFGAFSQYDSPQVDSLIDAADTELDQKKREMLYQQVQQIFVDDAPQVFIAYPQATAAWQSYISGFAIESLSFYRFEEVRVNK